MTTTAKAALIAATTMAMANSLTKFVTTEGNEIKVAKDTYAETLPEGITVDMIKSIQAHNATFFPAIEHVIGQAGNAIMKADDSVTELKTAVPLIGRDHYDISQKRMRESVNPGDRTQVTQKWGAMSSNLITHAAEKGSELSHVRSFLNEEAKAAYGK